jgi:4-carboxymuconolactone decarboxylase
MNLRGVKMPRITFPAPETMTSEQRLVYDKIVSGPRGRIEGPLRAALYNAELADRWQALGALLRYNTSLTKRQSEIAILVTGRSCNSPFEWYAHRRESEKIGIEQHILESILAQTEPLFEQVDERLIFQFAVELNRYKSVSDATYSQALDHFDAKTLVELTALVGYYTMVAMTLNAHEIPLPDGVAGAFSLPQDGVMA